MMIVQGDPTVCLRCEGTDKVTVVGVLNTDFGGKVSVFGCTRCGVIWVMIEGMRPS